ncbi:hypothetical protein V8E54_005941 [Elaphomyces granulatus]|jgi:hypothetical protein
MKYSGGICYGTIPGFNTKWNRDIKIVQGKERKLIEAPLWRIRPREKGVMGEGIEITGHVPSPSPIDHSPITTPSCLFDDPAISFIEARHLIGFIVTATHTTNRWTQFIPESKICNWESLGEFR